MTQKAASVAPTGQVLPSDGSAKNVQYSLLLFRVGVAWMAVDAHAVDEVAELAEITALPKLPPYLPGLIFLRGHAVPLLDLAAFLQIDQIPDPEEDPRPTRVVVISHQKMRVGVASNQVRGVMQRRGAQLKAPETLPESIRSFASAQIQDHEDLIAVLHLDHLFEEARPRGGRK